MYCNSCLQKHNREAARRERQREKEREEAKRKKAAQAPREILPLPESTKRALEQSKCPCFQKMLYDQLKYPGT